MIPLADSVPRRGFPVMLWALVIANALVFLVELQLSPATRDVMIQEFAIRPARISAAVRAHDLLGIAEGLGSFLSSAFIHGGWLHILGNMWMLWIFGDNVEDRMGSVRFLVFYVVCALCAGTTHVLLQPSSPVPAIGASGAIAGVLGAYFVSFPRARVVTLIPILFYPLFIEVPAVLFLLLWFVLQLVSGAASLSSGGAVAGVAWWAHVGGFLSGALLVRPFSHHDRVHRRQYRDEDAWEHAWHRR